MKKKLLFLIPILAVLLLVSDVFAYNSTFVPDLILPPYTILAEWNTDTSYTTISMGFQSDSTNIGLDSQKAYFYEYMGGQSNDWNGTSIVFSTDKGFIANNSYNMSFVLCSQNSLVIDRVNIGTSTGPWTQALSGNWATINNWSVTTISDYSSDSMNFSPCRNVVVNFTSNYTGSFVALRFRTHNNSPFGNYLGFMGYIYDNEGKNYTTFFNEINGTLDDLLDADAEPSVTPDDSKYDDYESAEGSLKDKVSQADLSNLSIAIDRQSSSWVWDTLTSLLQSHSAIFGTVIAILSIGIIKLALGR